MAAFRMLTIMALSGVSGLTACGYPFGPCFAEHIQVAQEATLDRGASPVDWDGAGIVAPGNTSDFEQLRRFLIDGRTLEAGQQAVWTVNTGTGYVALFLPVTASTGDVLQLSAVTGGGWGLASGTGAAISLLDGSFQAQTARGTVTVVSTGPLRVRVDVFTTDGEDSRTLLAELEFSFSRERIACT